MEVIPLRYLKDMGSFEDVFDLRCVGSEVETRLP